MLSEQPLLLSFPNSVPMGEGVQFVHDDKPDRKVSFVVSGFLKEFVFSDMRWITVDCRNNIKDSELH